MDWLGSTLELLKARKLISPPPENERMSPEKGPSLKELSSFNHQFSGDMLVFRGIIFSVSGLHVLFLSADFTSKPSAEICG